MLFYCTFIFGQKVYVFYRSKWQFEEVHELTPCLSTLGGVARLLMKNNTILHNIVTTKFIINQIINVTTAIIIIHLKLTYLDCQSTNIKW